MNILPAYDWPSPPTKNSSNREKKLDGQIGFKGANDVVAPDAVQGDTEASSSIRQGSSIS